jgi:RND superfamily putative drug exporter
VSVGPIGRLGRWTATHARGVFAAWLVIAIVLGFFAPRVEHALSGAGWQTTGSESVAARDMIDRKFDGLSSSALVVVISSGDTTIDDPAFASTLTRVERELMSSDAVARGCGLTSTRRTSPR